MRTGGWIVVLSLLVAAGAAACTGDGGDETPRTGLSRALAGVGDTAKTRTRVEYGDFDAMREATGGLFFNRRYARIAGHGAKRVLPNPNPMTRTELDPAGFDPSQAQQAIYAGGDDGAGLLLGGFVLADVETKLTGLKATKESGEDSTVWSLTGANVGKTWNPGLAALSTSDPGIGYARSKRELAPVSAPGEQTLAADESFETIAGCLGDDITAATIYSPSKRMTGVVRYAAGVQARDPKRVTEVFCVVTSSKSVRDRVAAETRGALSRLTATKDVEVSGGGTLVKATGRPRGAGAQPGAFLAYFDSRPASPVLLP
ncbi:hypothetical protein [Flindersiella endophytica]